MTGPDKSRHWVRSALGASILVGLVGLVGLAGLLGISGCKSQSLGGVREWCENGVDDDDDGLVDCADEDCATYHLCGGSQVCGDGVITGGEECDGMDVGGRTCADVIPGSVGTLWCGSDCMYETVDCFGTPLCGNAVREFGEECDCGTDPFDLPSGCTDINGAPAGGCSQTCQWSQEPTCEAELWEPCDALSLSACCPDDWDHTTQCASLGPQDVICLRECSATLDCFWSTECGAVLSGICYPAVCGPGYPNDTMQSFCQVSGGGPGWCSPFFDRINPDDLQYGVCVESGALSHGDLCQPTENLLYQDRTVDGCENGLCLPTQDPSVGICRQLCDWEAAYEAAIYGLSGEILPCPTGANCLNYARLDEVTGVRTGDFGYCIEQGTMDHPYSATTCSLITGLLLGDPSMLCSDVMPSGRCHMVQLASGEMANGTLTGVCAPGQPGNRDVWELCNPATDLCAPGSSCRAQDFFATNPTGPRRCLPLCDAQFHTAPSDCTTLGAGDPAASCRSLSVRLAPTDTSPTRLGLCALP